jgi:hypothetical protein
MNVATKGPQLSSNELTHGIIEKLQNTNMHYYNHDKR